MYTPSNADTGGVFRSRILIEQGFSNYQIAKEVEAGRLLRIRRGWLATPAADPQLVYAARHGLVISCITQASRLGLWVLDSKTPHFAVQRHGAEARPPSSVLHYRQPLLPRQNFALSDPIENVLVLVAHCAAFEDAVTVWDSALNKKLISFRSISQLPLSTKARAVLDASSPFADSGLESLARRRLTWLRIPIRLQAWVHGHRVDLLIGERLVLQIDGAHHVGAQRSRDIQHDARITLRGYTVIRVSYDQVVHRWHEVQELVLQAIAQGLHLATK